MVSKGTGPVKAPCQTFTIHTRKPREETARLKFVPLAPTTLFQHVTLEHCIELYTANNTDFKPVES